MGMNEIKITSFWGVGRFIFPCLNLPNLCVCVKKPEMHFMMASWSKYYVSWSYWKQSAHFQQCNVNTCSFVSSFVWLLGLLPLSTNLPSTNAYADKWNANKCYAMGTQMGEMHRGSYTSVQMVVPKCQVICNEEKRLPNIGLKIKRVCLQKRIWWFSSVHLFIDDHFSPLCLDIPPKQTAWSSPWEPIQRLSFIYKFHYTKEQNVLADWIDITWQPTDFSIWEKYLAPTEKS